MATLALCSLISEYRAYRFVIYRQTNTKITYNRAGYLVLYIKK